MDEHEAMGSCTRDFQSAMKVLRVRLQVKYRDGVIPPTRLLNNFRISFIEDATDDKYGDRVAQQLG